MQLSLALSLSLYIYIYCLFICLFIYCLCCRLPPMVHVIIFQHAVHFVWPPFGRIGFGGNYINERFPISSEPRSAKSPAPKRNQPGGHDAAVWFLTRRVEDPFPDMHAQHERGLQGPKKASIHCPAARNKERPWSW